MISNYRIYIFLISLNINLKFKIINIFNCALNILLLNELNQNIMINKVLLIIIYKIKLSYKYHYNMLLFIIIIYCNLAKTFILYLFINVVIRFDEHGTYYMHKYSLINI